MNVRLLAIARRSLGVNCWATKTDIKRAFRQRALILHPDTAVPYPGRKARTVCEMFTTLVKSYQLLTRFTSPAQRNRFNGARKKAKLGYAIARLEDVSYKFDWQE
jgi:DnaJ-class molecular chaperone